MEKALMEKILEPTSQFTQQPADTLACDNAQGYYLRATFRLANKRTQEAIADLEIAKKMDPEHAYSHWLLGITHAATNKSLALKELTEAAELFRAQGIHEMAKASDGDIKKLRASA